MSSKPETTFYRGVHRYLPDELHHEKMYNPLRGGTWDFWISGLKADLWVEYKFIELPKRDTTIILPNLSPLQLDWGRKRHREGRNLAVIVGCKEGGVVYTHCTWEKELSTQQFRAYLQTRPEIAKWILQQTMP